MYNNNKYINTNNSSNLIEKTNENEHVIALLRHGSLYN